MEIFKRQPSIRIISVHNRSMQMLNIYIRLLTPSPPSIIYKSTKSLIYFQFEKLNIEFHIIELCKIFEMYSTQENFGLQTRMVTGENNSKKTKDSLK